MIHFNEGVAIVLPSGCVVAALDWHPRHHSVDLPFGGRGELKLPPDRELLISGVLFEPGDPTAPRASQPRDVVVTVDRTQAAVLRASLIETQAVFGAIRREEYLRALRLEDATSPLPEATAVSVCRPWDLPMPLHVSSGDEVLVHGPVGTVVFCGLERRWRP